MKPTINVLGSRGHITLTWDPDDPEDVARARAEVETLRSAGYTFFLTEGAPADEVAAGRGQLLVRRLDDPVTELSEPVAEPEELSPIAKALYEELTKPDAPRRRGRPPSNPAPRQAAAVPRMAGG